MEKGIVTDIRALRRALEGGTSVEKVVWSQGHPPPPALWQLIKKYRLTFQQVPMRHLPPHAKWAAYLSPVPLLSLEAWEAAPVEGIALALIGLSDPRNVGAICRSAAAFGIEWVLLRAEGTPLLSNEAIWRASAGALPHLRLVRHERPLAALQTLKTHGWRIVGTTAPTPSALSYKEWNWKLPTIVILGSEEKGIPPAYKSVCEAFLTIPHEPTIQSLNVSAAAAILLAEGYAIRNS